MKQLLTLALPAAMLAACSSGGADSDRDGQVSREEAVAEASNVRLNPGQWEMTMQFTEIDAPGVPEGQREMMRNMLGTAHTSRQCLTEADVANPEADMFGGAEEQNCNYTDFNMSGGTILIAGTCGGDSGSSSTMRMDGTYSPTEYDMTLETTVAGLPTGDVRMQGQMSGRRLGDCTDTAEDDSADGDK